MSLSRQSVTNKTKLDRETIVCVGGFWQYLVCSWPWPWPFDLVLPENCRTTK